MDQCRRQVICKRCHRLRLGRFCLALLLASFASLGFARTAAAVQDLQLEVFLDGRPTDLIGGFTQFPDGRLGATPGELRELGIRIADTQLQSSIVRLDDIPTLVYVYRPETQSLDIRVGDESREPHVFDASGGRDPAPDIQTGKGLIVNYALIGTATSNWRSDGTYWDGGSALLDSRLYGPYGVLQTSAIVREGNDFYDPFLLLDTTWSFSDPGSLMTYRAGDVISSGVAWSRPIRIGGVQAQRNFGLRPDLVTRPLPSYSGSAVVPSIVDVYVNNAKTFSQEVPAGPFEISNIPTVTGSGAVTVAIRDAAGQETATTAPFFASSELLRQGLLDFSIEAGVSRQDYSSKSAAYDDDPLIAGTVRYGLTDSTTVEVHAEGASKLINVGLGLATLVSPWGRISTAGSLSLSDHELGGQVYGAVELHFKGLIVQASTQRTFGAYADLGMLSVGSAAGAYFDAKSPLPLYIAGPPSAQDQISLSIPMPFDDTRLNLAVLHLESPYPGASYDIASASYARPFYNDSSLLITAFKGFGGDDELGAYVGISMPLGRNGSASLQVSQFGDDFRYGATYAKSVTPEPGSLGWQASVLEGDHPVHQASLTYRGTHAEVRAGAVQVSDSVVGSVEVNGAIVATREGVFLTNRIDDAFAIVDVGAADVDVLFENRRVATTGQDGMALVQGLRSYEPVKISIDPARLPINAELPVTEVHVTPAAMSGVTARFGVTPVSSAALLVIRRPDGTFLPLGSKGRVNDEDEDLVVGYDGQAYATRLAATNTLVVELPDGPCQAEFPYSPAADIQTFIDPVICR